MRLDEANTMRLSTAFSFHSWFIGKKLCVASNGLWWHIKRLSAKKRTLDITYGSNCYDSKRFELLLGAHMNLEAFSFSRLTYNGEVTTLTWPCVTDIRIRDIQIKGIHAVMQSTMFETSSKHCRLDTIANFIYARSLFMQVNLNWWPNLNLG